MTERFISALKKFQNDFGLDLNETQIHKLDGYFRLVQENNHLLHLVAPCSPEEFALRHILESLTLLEFLPRSVRFADVGTGAGLPSIPCLLMREDLQGVLIESKLKKAAFLREVLSKCDLENRTLLINQQFEEISNQKFSFVTCRALDKFTQKLPKLLKWARESNLLFFGGPNLREGLKKNGVKFEEKLMPFSEQRFLFIGQKPAV